MKKLFIATLLMVCAFVPSFAQKAKFAHVDYGSIMKEMPGIDTAQQALLNFQQELEAVGQQMANEFKTKQTEYANLANTTTSATVLKVKEDEILKLYQRLQEFMSSSEMELQNKQIELLRPFQDKLLEAIKVVAENGKYTYVFDVTMCAFHNDAEDLTDAVKKQVGISK